MVRACSRAYKNPYMCGAMCNVQHSLAMASLNIYKPTQMTNETQILVKKTGWRLKMKQNINVNSAKNQ